MDIKVSVVMPVYNAHAFLRSSMDSLCNQTLKEIQIICVDDGSTDDTPEILAEYAEKDSRVKIIRQNNAGAGAARNNGIGYASGEYLSIVDCDDFFEPDMLEKSYCLAREKDADMVVFGCDLYDDLTRQYRSGSYAIRRELLPDKQVFCADDIKRDVFKVFIGWSWDKLFRREFVQENRMTFQEQRTTNDLLFVFNGLLRAKRIAVMPQVLAHHRRRNESLSVTREKSWHCFYDALMALRQEMHKIGCYARFEQDYLNYCVHFSLWNLNTLQEPTHTLLYNKLREEWFAEMGVLDHPESYFYNKYEYRCFRNVYEHPVEWVKKQEEIAQRRSGNLFFRAKQCIEENGLRYTLKRVIGKLLGLLGE